MSAGGLSYSGLRNYGKSSLPSVDAGLGSLNILKDPPRSLYVRRIDKVGQTSDITQWIQDSGDRACENIRAFPRGINPFVSVSYQNSGTGGANPTSVSARPQARLPYAIGAAGNDVFRPPVLRQENLYPLSRLPRIYTSAFTNPEFPDFQKKMVCPQNADKTYGVKVNLLEGSIRPTKTYQIEKPIDEPFEVKYVIQNPLKTSGSSGMGGNMMKEFGIQEYTKFNKGNTDDKVKYNYNTQIGNVRYNMSENNFNTDKYIQNTLHSDVSTNIKSNVSRNTPIDQIIDIKTKDSINISYTAPQSSSKSENYIHGDVQLSRSIPSYQAKTNQHSNIYVNNIPNQVVKEYERNIPLSEIQLNRNSSTLSNENVNNLNYTRLPPRPSLGGFDNSGNIPSSQRQDQYSQEDFMSPKNTLDKKVSEFFDGRYRDGGNDIDFQKLNSERRN
jgi:hypothetical protein